MAGNKYRSHIYGEGEKNTVWRYGAPPNYDRVNKLFEEDRTQETILFLISIFSLSSFPSQLILGYEWPSGSLEETLQNLVKTFEMELFHKPRLEDYKTINLDRFTLSINGGRPMKMEEIVKVGGYNAFLQTTLPHRLQAHDPSAMTSESSHEVFSTTFPRGFALEVLQVYSGPPVVAYKFRHWGYMEGPFKGHPPTGEKVELIGISVVEVDESLRFNKLEFIYDAGELLAGLLKNPISDETPSESSIGCPFMK
ncbi:pathogen-related protein-like [Macadamia integrifolia]|uniref:pathogen-related protein-like n=1 Tax=Macadamia integrifolia TaxID=60698 RepID=UPI001C4F57E8|nr:pathogen-related protein-like [Macadamia integrifolia]